jgi:hypothetical protein
MIFREFIILVIYSLLISLSLETNLTTLLDQCEQCNLINNSTLETNTTNVCDIWTKKNIYVAEDVHFYNQTLPFVQIDTLTELNITSLCSPTQYKIVDRLKIFARNKILFDNDLDLSGVINIFNLSNVQSYVSFENVYGFNENSREFTIEKEIALSKIYDILFIEFSNVIFDFYRRGNFLKSEECKKENFEARPNFFGPLKNLLLTQNVFYNSKICPYVFMNTKVERLDLSDISNSLIFMNRFEFLNIINEPIIYNRIRLINVLIYKDSIMLANLNPFAFKTLKYLVIEGNLETFEEDLFENFKEISLISLISDDLINFFHRGTKWLNSINKNLNVSYNNKRSLIQNTKRLVSVEIAVINGLYFNRFYTFPNEDICLFKNFPHSQLVLPLIVFDPAKFDSGDCSCTLIWLQQYYKYYFSSDFSIYDENINIDLDYKNLFLNESFVKCHRSEKYFNEKFNSCNFSQRFEKCDFNTNYKTFPLNGIYSLRFMIKWFKYVIEVYFRTILCFIGLVTNILTIIVIRNKKHAKNFSNSMYKHICVNALFNIGYCLIYLLSLMSICIYQKTSFCSSIYRTGFAQYFYIYVIQFLGNTFRLCCNISYIFFSISRFALSGTSNKSKLRKFFVKQNIKRFYIINFILSLGFSSFLVFENKVNTLFEIFTGFDLDVGNNVYDKIFCESVSLDTRKEENFQLTPSFNVNCEIFKWFNMVNNILNNGLFLIISVLVDFFMIRFSNEVIKEKKALNSPHLSEAIAYKTKLNKMIITNCTLFFLSRFPEFLATVIYYFSKSIALFNFCYKAFNCTNIIEMAQAFHFISVGFQFFIFLKFDQNFKHSIHDLVLSIFKN